MRKNVLTCGIAVADIIVSNLSRIASPGEVVFSPVGLHVGGHACNVSIDLRQMGAEKVSTAICVGDDPFGEFIESYLREKGVSVHVNKVRAGTSKNVILVEKGEDRRFHADAGANEYLSPSFIRRILKNERPEIFYIGGTGWLGKFDSELGSVCKAAKKMGCTVFCDIIRPHGKDWDYILPAFPFMDIFHCNATEAASITGEKSVRRAMEKISSKVCLVTSGAGGTLARLPDGWLKMGGYKIKAVDPTGAGDAFCAGVIFKLLKYEGVEEIGKEDWVDILRYASACGAACCTGVGTTWAVTRGNIKRVMRSSLN